MPKHERILHETGNCLSNKPNSIMLPISLYKTDISHLLIWRCYKK